VRIVILSLASLLVATGCVGRQSPNAVEYPAAPAAADPAVHVVVADVNMTDEDSDEATPPSPPVLGAPGALRPAPEPVLFRLGAGYGALGHVDLGPCRELGMAPGYVRMRVTFRHSGAVAHATVESEAQPPPQVLTCIGERLQVAMVPRFDGDNVTLSKSLFVAPDGLGPPVVVQ